MIQKLQKFFHVDKWWGRVLLMISFYLVFFIGYWALPFLIMKIGYLELGVFENDWLPFLYFFILLPLLSFFFVYKIKKNFCFKINLYILFLINLILVLTNLLGFVLFAISQIRPDF